MKENKKWTLFHKRLTSEIDSTDRTLLEEQLREEEVQRSFRKTEQIWLASKNYESDFQPDIEAGLAKLKDRIAAEHSVGKNTNARIINLRKVLQLVAGVALLITAVWLGKNYLNNSSVAVQTAFTESASRTIDLADGTVVTMNKASRLDFPVAMNTDERRVKLNGEAFFEVTSDKDHPFFIETPQVEVKVVGTAFNLRSYPDEATTEITVTHGKVIFKCVKSDQSWEVTANQRLTFNHQTQTAEKQTDHFHNARSWQLKRLIFDDTPLSEVTKALERYLDIQIDIEKNAIRSCLFDVDFSDENAEEAMQVISTAFKADFRKVGPRHYSLQDGECIKTN